MLTVGIYTCFFRRRVLNSAENSSRGVANTEDLEAAMEEFLRKQAEKESGVAGANAILIMSSLLPSIKEGACPYYLPFRRWQELCSCKRGFGG
jgi:hypothetical protein